MSPLLSPGAYSDDEDNLDAAITPEDNAEVDLQTGAPPVASMGTDMTPALPGASTTTDIQRRIDPLLAEALQAKIALKEAQGRASNNRMAAGLAGALGQITHGISGASGQFNDAPFKQLQENANAPVVDFQGQQSLRDKDLTQLRNILALKLKDQKQSADNLRQVTRDEATDKYRAQTLDLQQKTLGIKDRLATNEENKQNKEKGPKQIPSGQVVSINDGNNSLKLLDDLEGSINGSKDLFGPVKGWLTGNNPYNERATTIQAQFKTAAQKIGTYLENGKLTDKDVPKYETMLPALRDAPEVAANKLDLVRRLVAAKQASDAQALEESGYDVAGIKKTSPPHDLPPILQNKPTKRHVTSKELDEYASKHNLSIEESKNFLRGKGYATD